MEKSRNPGNTLSKSIRSIDETRASLKTLTRQTPLSTLLKAFNSDVELYLVGGTVRDIALGKEPHDFDLAVNLEPEQIEKQLEKHEIRVIETGLQHGTLTAVVDGHNVEITSFRDPEERRFSERSIQTDISGRDFTINAIAYCPKTDSLIDPCDGMAHLRENLLIAVGEPLARFTEDPLRILRMIRFGQARGRTVNAATHAAARQCLAALNTVSIERIRLELDAILMSPHPTDGIRAMQDLGILESVLPEILPAIGFEQNEHHIHDVFDHSLWVLERTPEDIVLRWAALFHDLGKVETLSTDQDGRRHFYRHEEYSTQIAKEVSKRLKFSNDRIKAIQCVVRHHMRPLTCGPAGVRRLFRDLGEYFDLWREFKIADAPPRVPEQEFCQMLKNFDAMVAEERERLKDPAYGTLAINGDDLKALGLPEGKGLGLILKQVEELVLEDPTLNTRDELLRRAKKIINEESSGD